MAVRWFLLVAAGTSMVLLLASGALVALLDLPRPGVVLAAAGTVLAVMAATSCPVLVASTPSRDPDRGRRWRLWVPAAVAVLGLALLLAGLWSGLGPLAATGTTLAYAVVLLAPTLPLLRWARHVARTSPTDAPRPGDDDRLAPAALRARLLRVAALAGGLGVVAGVATVAGLGHAGAPWREVTVLGGGAVVFVAAIVVAAGTGGPLFAAGRRANAVAHNHSRVGWRVAWAVQVGRTRRLSPEDHETAVRWAHAAQPLLVLQAVFQLATLSMVLGAQLMPLLIEPERGFRLWLAVVLGVLVLAAAVLLPQQYVATRRFARAHPLPAVQP